MDDDQIYDLHYKKQSKVSNKSQSCTSRISFVYFLGVFILCFLSAYIAWLYGISEGRKQYYVIVEPITGLTDGNGKEDITAGSFEKVSASVVKITEAYPENVVSTSDSSKSWCGIVWAANDETGSLILTDANVVNSDQLNVITSDGTEYPATVVTNDDIIGFGVVRTDVVLSAVTFNSEDNITPGIKVFSIDYTGRKYEGIISVGSKNIKINDSIRLFMQSNFCLDENVQGGGLFNSDGTFIGFINSSDTNLGISYAIPGNVIYDTMLDLLTKGYVAGRVDVDFMKFSEIKVPNLLQQREGLRIIDVDERVLTGPVLGDYLIAINDTIVLTKKEWRDTLRSYNVLDTVVLTYLHGTEIYTVNVVLNEENDESKE
ncbi:MAG: S1C family serine protease [Christensenellaceae bacterium]|jgi:S1-C subfamily serine protease|nr:S1C family serine protease [Christensenellaceae bacterium]